MARLLLSIPEVVEQTGLSRATIYRVISSGKILSVTVGKSRRITPRALQLFIDNLEKDARAELSEGLQ